MGFELGEQSYIGPNNSIGINVKVRDNVSVLKFNRLETGVILMDYVFIGCNIELEDGVILSEGSVICIDVVVGTSSKIKEFAEIAPHVRIGANVIIGKKSKIEANVKIGIGTVIGREALIKINVLHHVIIFEFVELDIIIEAYDIVMAHPKSFELYQLYIKYLESVPIDTPKSSL